MADEGSIDLLSTNYKRGQLAELETAMLLQVFAGSIAAVTGQINDGKEATVYCCLGHQAQYYAAKVYRDRRFRAFAKESTYQDPNGVGDRRLAKAIRKRSKIGRRTSQRLWIQHEWQALNRLYDAGASVPEPFDHAPDAILMELIGSDTEAAPMLAQLQLNPADAQRAWHDILEDIEILLHCRLIHGDLSAYNILYHQGRPRLIDLPQVLDTDGPADSWTLFHRDISNIAGYFARQGLEIDALDLAIRLWQKYV
jgi:RIO kinase 1